MAPGRAVKLYPIKPTLKAPGIKHLKLTYDKPLSKFALKFNLRCYSPVPVDKSVVGLMAKDTEPVIEQVLVTGRGLLSSTFQLNLCALDGIGGARRGRVAPVKGVLGAV